MQKNDIWKGQTREKQLNTQLEESVRLILTNLKNTDGLHEQMRNINYIHYMFIYIHL